MTIGRIAIRALPLIATGLLLPASARADLTLDAVGMAVSEDFDAFRGLGFHHAPMDGQLDSDTWRLTGFSDGDGVFGGVHDGGDFARGRHTGGTSTGGVFAFETSADDYALGVQSGSSDFTPGAITLRVRNETDTKLFAVALTYDVLFYNDQDRSSRLGFSWSLDDATWTDLVDLDTISPETRDDEPAWTASSRGTLLRGIDLNPGEVMYLRWTGDDFAGTGSRDEFALDNVSVMAIPSPGALMLLGLAGLVARRRR